MTSLCEGRVGRTVMGRVQVMVSMATCSTPFHTVASEPEMPEPGADCSSFSGASALLTTNSNRTCHFTSTAADNKAQEI